MENSLLPAGFRFSQSNLHDYTECKKQFILRWIKRLDWPAALTNQAIEQDRAVNRGQLFHEWILQEALGMEVLPMVLALGDPQLTTWWHNYTKCHSRTEIRGIVHSEMELAVPLCGYWLVAKFDRVIRHPDGHYTIVDWKTGRKRPLQTELLRSWQTVVYRYVLVQAGALVNAGRPVAPTDVQLVYWHAAYPHALQPIPYSDQAHARAREQIETTVQEILSLREAAQFTGGGGVGNCDACRYRSYCGAPDS